MTTIAYRNGILAADTRVMVAGWKTSYTMNKLFRLGPAAGHAVAAISGSVSSCQELVYWLRCPVGGRPSLADDSRVIVLRAMDFLTVYEGAGSFDIETKYVAFGSGMPPATAALHMGASARKAVEIASLIDDSTNSEVCWLSIKTKGQSR